jgi:hypothetical protein
MGSKFSAPYYEQNSPSMSLCSNFTLHYAQSTVLFVAILLGSFSSLHGRDAVPNASRLRLKLTCKPLPLFEGG